MKTLRLVLTLLALVLLAPTQAQFVPPAPAIYGVVMSRSQNRPVIGATISLVHPVIGRSLPSFSSPPAGSYAFFNIPPRNEPFYIEAYWGSQLLYRGVVAYKGGSVQLNIQLP